MAYEVTTAFFLGTGFLGVMPFGTSKIGKGLHFFTTCRVSGFRCGNGSVGMAAIWISSVVAAGFVSGDWE